MSCDEARAHLSDAVDGRPMDASVAQHVHACPACRAFERRLWELRAALRLEVIDAPADIAPAVIARLRRDDPPARLQVARRARRWNKTAWRRPLAAAAIAFVAGVVAGFVLVNPGGGSGPGIAAAELPRRVLAAQRELDTFAAEVEVRERGWHRDIPERRWTGTLRYRAPESFALEVEDRTPYPSHRWRRSDVSVVVDDDRSWSRGVRDCPSISQPQCTPPLPRVAAMTNREPFAEGTPVPLDLVLPAASFTLAAPPAEVAHRRVAGRDAVGVDVTAAQVAPVLDALHIAGNLRQLHPTDPVRLWLDEETLVLLALRASPAPGPERARWAAARGYDDSDAGSPVLEVDLANPAVNRPLPPGSFPPVPRGARIISGSFTEAGRGEALRPDLRRARVDGMRPFRSGLLAHPAATPIAVRSFTDGRAWVAIRATTQWSQPRLFGSGGRSIRVVPLPGAGVGYLSEDGRVLVHGDGIELAVSGSLDPDRLVAVTAGFGIEGRPVPTTWAEAATAPLGQAEAARPGLLVPSALTGFGPPAVRIDEDVVTLSYPGPGTRGFVLVEADGDRLPPPTDPDARGVRIRTVTGRYSPATGELTWIEGGTVFGLRSATLSAAELVAIANRLRPA